MPKEPLQLLKLGEVARSLGMRPSNVAAFLERRKVRHVAEDASGRKSWDRRDIERVRAEYEESGRRTIDEKRRATQRAKAEQA